MMSKTHKKGPHAPSPRGEVLRVQQRGVAKFLGEWEARVMEIVWHQGRATVQEVHQRLRDQGLTLAYTTVLTEMQNLAKKGLLRSHRQGRRNVYEPVMSREAFLEERISRTVQSLLQDFPDQVLAHLFPEGEVDTEVKSLLEKLRTTYQKEDPQTMNGWGRVVAEGQGTP